MIEDALKIGFTRNAQLIERFQQQLESQIVSVPYGKWHTVVGKSEEGITTRVKLKRAGTFSAPATWK